VTTDIEATGVGAAGEAAGVDAMALEVSLTTGSVVFAASFTAETGGMEPLRASSRVRRTRNG
jgi:hypothetical protein